jgi:hypothetical protein
MRTTSSPERTGFPEPLKKFVSACSDHLAKHLAAFFRRSPLGGGQIYFRPGQACFGFEPGKFRPIGGDQNVREFFRTGLGFKIVKLAAEICPPEFGVS